MRIKYFQLSLPLSLSQHDSLFELLLDAIFGAHHITVEVFGFGVLILHSSQGREDDSGVADEVLGEQAGFRECTRGIILRLIYACHYLYFFAGHGQDEGILRSPMVSPKCKCYQPPWRGPGMVSWHFPALIPRVGVGMVKGTWELKRVHRNVGF